MDFSRQVSHALDDDHRANLELLGRVEQAIARPPHGIREPDFPRLAAALARQLQHDIGRHFEFEERELFPRLAAAGEGDIAGLLEEEHGAIRAVAAELLPLALAAAGGNLADTEFAALRRTALELIERQVAHIQKETLALLPMLDHLLDDDTDRDLAFAYAAG